ncbi:unnamed protein product [Leptidea sinapis]|uniref:Uncharacterized protein n=1 Tax=Leptidea sinapis TaxID=189913 RepID=A0A5E4QFL6_9NEOP|nr:unnamed protein product [Leptidea sinapis]
MRPEHQLKSIRYTTIPNKRTQNRKYLKSTRVPTTEYITIRKNNVKHFTEKYLSFDELLRLRKVSADIYGARRAGENTTATTASADTKAQENTTEYTANTPFKRLKHCSRKLTCTWTAASLTNDPNKNRGSRTPPGYVEGCTRTSTCTRDDMNRNKMASTTDPSIEVESDSGGDDDDYCEKRALDIQRRNANIDIHDKTSLSLRDQEHSSSIIKPLDAINGNDKYACECDDSIRKKRELNEDDELVTKKCHKKRSKLSYVSRKKQFVNSQNFTIEKVQTSKNTTSGTDQYEIPYQMSCQEVGLLIFETTNIGAAVAHAPAHTKLTINFAATLPKRGFNGLITAKYLSIDIANNNED